jgi:hypothetical protein
LALRWRIVAPGRGVSLTYGTMENRPARGRHHLPVMHRVAFALVSATLLAACGSSATSAAASSTTQRASTTTTTSKKDESTTATSALPPPCSLVTKAQASAALGATVTEIKPTVVGSKIGCKWVVKSASLTAGLGSNIVLSLRPPPKTSRSAFYKQVEGITALDFKPVTLAGIPAVAGFGAQNEVQADVGRALLTIAALSTVSAAKNSTASEQVATDALEALCQKISCRR